MLTLARSPPKQAWSSLQRVVTSLHPYTGMDDLSSSSSSAVIDDSKDNMSSGLLPVLRYRSLGSLLAVHSQPPLSHSPIPPSLSPPPPPPPPQPPQPPSAPAALDLYPHQRCVCSCVCSCLPARESTTSQHLLTSSIVRQPPVCTGLFLPRYPPTCSSCIHACMQPFQACMHFGLNPHLHLELICQH